MKNTSCTVTLLKPRGMRGKSRRDILGITTAILHPGTEISDLQGQLSPLQTAIEMEMAKVVLATVKRKSEKSEKNRKL